MTDRRVIAALCVVGALRIFVFSAAFPPFHSSDEHFHFDLVVKYAHGHVPYRLADERLSAETRDAIVLYGTGISRSNAGSWVLYDSPEYLSPETAEGVPPPAWMAPEAVRPAILANGRDFWNVRNHEAMEPPFYYAIAGAWYRLGMVVGLTGGHLFYWTRLLNSALFAGVVWLAYLFARESCPGNRFLALGVAVLVTVFPQDSFFGVSNDGPLAPLLFAAALYSLLRIARAPRPWPQYAAAGLLVAATFLTKYSNVAIVGALLITLAVAGRSAWAKSSRADAWRLAVLALVALAPVTMWFTRNYLLSGDFTGSQQKYAKLGWTLKSLGAIWDHPFFGRSAPEAVVRDFLHGVLTTLWRGEIAWHRKPMALRSVDCLYSISSALFLVFAAIRARDARDHAEKTAIWTSAATVICAIGSLAVLSTVFDFGEHAWPSTHWPYFTNGRLIVGILVPFVTLYVYGLEWGLTKARMPSALVPFLVGLALIFTASQAIVARPAFESLYNWFSLLQAAGADFR